MIKRCQPHYLSGRCKLKPHRDASTELTDWPQVRIGQGKAFLRLGNNRNSLQTDTVTSGTIHLTFHISETQRQELKWDGGGEGVCVEPTWRFASLGHRPALPMGCYPPPGRSGTPSYHGASEDSSPSPPESGSRSGGSSFGPSSQKHTRKGMQRMWFLLY